VPIGEPTTRGNPPAALKGAGRAFGGAVLFATPIFMTMEVWRLGVTIPRVRLALLLFATVVLVVLLVRFFGNVPGRPGWPDVAADAGLAFLMAGLATVVILSAVAVIEPFTDWRAALSVLGLELMPAAVGASYARSQLGQGRRSAPPQRYADELLLMVAGAVVFAANIAPTEEVVLLATRMGPVQAGSVVVLSLVLMHGFVYLVDFKGEHVQTGGPVRSLLTFTVVGYAAALLVSAYLLWTFGRFDGTGAGAIVQQSVVLALPASLGAAAARLVL
jgi:putative integral membrane protein (TIGR02587 family)